MKASTSECSSGCESGWTTYLDQISDSDPYSRGDFYPSSYQLEKGAYVINEEDEEEEEDQSMVSDASSAPPYNYSTYSYAYGSPSHEDKKKKKITTKSKPRNEPKQQSLHCLDDTASSSILHFSHQDNVPRPNGHNSLEHVLEGESVTKKRVSFFKSSTKGKSSSGNLVQGRKRQ